MANEILSLKDVFFDAKEVGTDIFEVSQLKGKLFDLFGRDNILECAKNELIPHFRFVNPISKEVKYLFCKHRLKQWIEDNCIKKCETEYKLDLNYNFISVRNNDYCVSEIPISLSNVKNLFQFSGNIFSKISGIYFLCNDLEVLYVGQSTNIYARIGQHIADDKKEFDKAFFILVPSDRLNDIEGALIKYLQPIYNGSRKTKTIEPYFENIAKQILNNQN